MTKENKQHILLYRSKASLQIPSIFLEKKEGYGREDFLWFGLRFSGKVTAVSFDSRHLLRRISSSEKFSSALYVILRYTAEKTTVLYYCEFTDFPTYINSFYKIDKAKENLCWIHAFIGDVELSGRKELSLQWWHLIMAMRKRTDSMDHHYLWWGICHGSMDYGRTLQEAKEIVFAKMEGKAIMLTAISPGRGGFQHTAIS